MSRARVYHPQTIETISRFFEALDALIAKKAIRGYKTYCDLYVIDRRNLNAQKLNCNRGFFEVYWIIPLIKDFGVSAEWLLLGKGKMFK